MIHFYFQNVESGYVFFSLQTSASFKQKVLLLKNPSNSKSGLALTLGTVGSSPTGMIFLGFTSPHTAHPAMAHASAQPSPPQNLLHTLHKKPQQGFVSPRLSGLLGWLQKAVLVEVSSSPQMPLSCDFVPKVTGENLLLISVHVPPLPALDDNDA